jgi:hypothetical protein
VVSFHTPHHTHTHIAKACQDSHTSHHSWHHSTHRKMLGFFLQSITDMLTHKKQNKNFQSIADLPTPSIAPCSGPPPSRSIHIPGSW